MRKIFTLVAVFICAMSQAQTPFITPVAYRGAFAPAPTAMWTGTWTNFDPQNANYAGADSVISTAITSNLVLSGIKKYRLQGLIYVKNNATLTIGAGCIIKGDHTIANSSLIITRGSKIVAKGLSTKPIVFTSSQAIGSRSKGDWGGIIILGSAHYNGANGQNYIEGIAQSGDTQYGGGATPNDDDSSGVMQYVRIEYGGYIFAQNQEINGLTMGAVGRKTVIDHIQVSYSNDDAYEWFGGSVNCKYLVSYRNLDDNWDTDNGFSGAVQFCLAIRDPQIADNPLVSTSEGFESDNDATGSNAKPYTTAIFSNITDIGPYRGNTGNAIASGFRRSVRIRRNSHLRIVNSILMDFPTGVYIDGAACTALATGNFVNAGNNNPGNLVFRRNLVAGNATGKVIEKNTVWNAHAWFGANYNDSLVSTANILTDPYNFTAGDYRPVSGSPALKNYSFNDSAFYYIDSTGALQTLVLCPATVATPGSIVGKNIACLYIGSGDTARYYLSTKSNLGVLQYEWSVPAGVTLVSGQGSDTIIVTYNNTFTGGNLSVRNLSYCGVYSAYRTFAVKKGIPYTPGIISGPAFICDYISSGDTANYTISSVLYATGYNWTVPTGATIISGQNTTSLQVVFDNTFTTGSITVQGTAVCGNGALRSLALTKISAAPGYISGKRVTCGFIGDTLTYTVAPVVNATSYLWTVPAGATIIGSATGNSIDVVYSVVVAGTVTVKAITNCGQSTARALSIAKLGVPVSISGPITVCPADEPSYTVNDTLNNLGVITYTWTVPSGITILSGQGTATLNVSIDAAFLSGNITVKAVGCGTYSSVRTLTVSKDPGCKFGRPAKASVNNAALTYTVAPNPNKGNFTVYFNSKQKADKGTILILNAFGQIISQRSVTASNGIINEQIAESKLAPGMYIVKTTIGNETQTSKIVVQ